MIVDMHVHPFCKEATWDDLNKIADAMWGIDPQKRKYMLKMLKNLTKNVSINDYVKLMDKFGIDKSVIVSFNAKTALDLILVSNEDVSDFVKLYPNRFIGYAGIDVPSVDALEQLEYAITSLDLKGLKLVPPVQKIDISDKKYDKFWKKMVDLNIPLWTHGGHQVSTAGSIAKFGHPMLIDEVAMRHEDLKIIIGHIGTPWFWDAYVSYNITHKVIFASDHPLVHWNQIIPAVKNLTISDDFKDLILRRNAQKFLGL